MKPINGINQQPSALIVVGIWQRLVNLNLFQQESEGGGTSLVAKWLRLHAPNAGGLSLIPGQGTRSHMHAATKEPTCRN